MSTSDQTGADPAMLHNNEVHDNTSNADTSSSDNIPSVSIADFNDLQSKFNALMAKLDSTSQWHATPAPKFPAPPSLALSDDRHVVCTRDMKISLTLTSSNWANWKIVAIAAFGGLGTAVVVHGELADGKNKFSPSRWWDINDAALNAMVGLLSETLLPTLANSNDFTAH